MGSVEGDELRYDGGNRGASQEQVDAEHAAARYEARERVETRIENRHQGTLDAIHDDVNEVWDEVYRLIVKGRRQEAHALLDKAVESAVEDLIERETS